MKLYRYATWFTPLALMFLPSCGTDSGSTQVGKARLSLTTTSTSGIGYRLRDAIFDIEGSQDVAVLSETYPNSDGVMIVPLATGAYSVGLRDGFYLEYSTDEQRRNWTSVETEVTSNNPTEVSIVSNETTAVMFAFQVNGSLITFGGELGIGITVDDTASRCAPHFVEIPAAQVPMCGGGFMGPDPILEAYGCELESGYPPADICPAGMSLNNTLGVGFPGPPFYTCYVGQDVSATFSPPGCPISQGTVTCPAGFAPDPAQTRLTWGMGSSWACYYGCALSPDPKAVNPAYPCTASGFDAIGGSGDMTCCARW